MRWAGEKGRRDGSGSIKEPVCLSSGEGQLPGWRMAAFWLYPHMARGDGGCGERVRETEPERGRGRERMLH